MHTQTHALIGACFFGKRTPALMTVGAIAGAAPDLPMFVMTPVLLAQGHGPRQIFGDDYFQPFWQHINGLSHSLILWPLFLAIALCARAARPKAWWPALLVAAAAAGLAHAGVDFLCHREDAHMQFWPVSSWKFVSPVSYYDGRHFGRWAMLFEAAIGLFMGWHLFRAARAWWSRGLIVLVALPYLATLIFLPLRAARAEAGDGPRGSVALGRFDQGTAGWSTVSVDRSVPRTRYQLVHMDGITAIEAHADRSQALFVRDVDIAPEATPILCWRWRIAGVVERADIHTRKGDDQAARVLVGFALPAKALSFGARLKLAIGRMRYGRLLPDAALDYVWDNRVPVGTALPSAYTDRARMIVLETGNTRAGTWVMERRDLIADLQRTFGTPPRRMTLVALSTDTDNTGSVADAAYADLHLVPRGAPCQFTP